MAQVTAKDEIHAALQRLSTRDGYQAVQALLDKIGAANVNHIDDAAFNEVMAACPPLPQGQGLAVCTGADKPASVQDKLTADALARNKASEPDAGIGDDLKAVLDGEGGFDQAAKVLHARNKTRSQAAK